jgi:threonine/homoserine/homoserine lactone efflux protein
MSFMSFMLQTLLISLTGVMAPGPITALTVAKGSESPHAGAAVAAGHTIVEIPLIVAIFYGFGRLLELQYVKASIAIAGGIFLAVMAVGMIRSIRHAEPVAGRYTRSSLVTGIFLSAGNPYFLIWWATIGAAMILQSVSFGKTGLFAFSALHLACDFVWLYFLSFFSFRGGQFFGKVFQKVIFAGCGAFLVFLSVKFIIDGVKGFV